MEHTKILPVERASAFIAMMPNTIPPAPAVMALLSRFSRDELGNAIEVMVTLLDLWDADPDIEPNGDELDSSAAEDDFVPHNVPGHLQGPGCPIADDDSAADDIPCDDVYDDLEPEDDLFPDYEIDQSRGPLPEMPGVDRRMMRGHIERVRKTSCRKLARPNHFTGATHEMICG